MFDHLTQSAVDNKRFLFIDIKLALWGKKSSCPQSVSAGRRPVVSVVPVGGFECSCGALPSP